VNIRTFQQGDEAAQAAIYNEAAGALPQVQARDAARGAAPHQCPRFDPAMRFYAVEGNEPVAYIAFNTTTRQLSVVPQRHEALAEPLFQQMMKAMQERGYRQAFAAYRADWQRCWISSSSAALPWRGKWSILCSISSTCRQRSRGVSAVSKPLRREDVKALFALAPHLLRQPVRPGARNSHLFANPFFPPSSVSRFAQPRRCAHGRGHPRHGHELCDPKVIDSGMPCFRLGAFGTRACRPKRIKGLFSFLAPDDPQCPVLAHELMSHAAALLHGSDDITALAAQCPSNATHVLRFYQLSFRKQGSFPVLEKSLI